MWLGLQVEDDFAVVGGGLHVGEGFAGLSEGEGAVDDGVKMVGVDSVDHAAVHGAAADVDAFDVDGLG